MWDKIKEHPYLIGGGLIGAVVFLYVYSKSKSSSAPSNFNFSYGPSDAQIVAGTNLQIAQVQANAAVASQASSDAAASSIYQSYFGYLANNSANQLTAAQANDAAGLGVAQAQYGSATSIAQAQYGAATAIDASNNYASMYNNNTNVAGTEFVASTQAEVANQQNNYGFQETINQQNQNGYLNNQQQNFTYAQNIANLNAIQQVDDYEIYQSGIPGSGYNGSNFQGNGI